MILSDDLYIKRLIPINETTQKDIDSERKRRESGGYSTANIGFAGIYPDLEKMNGALFQMTNSYINDELRSKVNEIPSLKNIMDEELKKGGHKNSDELFSDFTFMEDAFFGSPEDEKLVLGQIYNRFNADKSIKFCSKAIDFLPKNIPSLNSNIFVVEDPDTIENVITTIEPILSDKDNVIGKQLKQIFSESFGEGFKVPDEIKDYNENDAIAHAFTKAYCISKFVEELDKFKGSQSPQNPMKFWIIMTYPSLNGKSTDTILNGIWEIFGRDSEKQLSGKYADTFGNLETATSNITEQVKSLIDIVETNYDRTNPNADESFSLESFNIVQDMKKLNNQMNNFMMSLKGIEASNQIKSFELLSKAYDKSFVQGLFMGTVRIFTLGFVGKKWKEKREQRLTNKAKKFENRAAMAKINIDRIFLLKVVQLNSMLHKIFKIEKERGIEKIIKLLRGFDSFIDDAVIRIFDKSYQKVKEETPEIKKEKEKKEHFKLNSKIYIVKESFSTSFGIDFEKGNVFRAYSDLENNEFQVSKAVEIKHIDTDKILPTVSISELQFSEILKKCEIYVPSAQKEQEPQQNNNPQQETPPEQKGMNLNNKIIQDTQSGEFYLLKISPDRAEQGFVFRGGPFSSLEEVPRKWTGNIPVVSMWVTNVIEIIDKGLYKLITRPRQKKEKETNTEINPTEVKSGNIENSDGLSEI